MEKRNRQAKIRSARIQKQAKVIFINEATSEDASETTSEDASATTSEDVSASASEDASASASASASEEQKSTPDASSNATIIQPLLHRRVKFLRNSALSIDTSVKV